jgi:hypothetical protein
MRGAHGEFLVHIVRKRDVHGVDLAAREEGIGILIVTNILHAVTAAQRVKLLRLPRHQSCQRAVALDMGEGREHGGLSNVP